MWLSVWSEVQIVCIWSRLISPFCYWLTEVVLEKRPLNGCCSSSCRCCSSPLGNRKQSLFLLCASAHAFQLQHDRCLRGNLCVCLWIDLTTSFPPASRNPSAGSSHVCAARACVCVTDLGRGGVSVDRPGDDPADDDHSADRALFHLLQHRRQAVMSALPDARLRARLPRLPGRALSAMYTR